MERIIYLGSRYPESVRFRGTGAGRSGIPYLALHPMGFSVPRRLRFARCALAAPFHPCRFEISNLRFEISKWRFNFLWHFPSKSLSAFRPRVSSEISNLKPQKLRGIAPFGVRTFLFRLAPEAILRPSKTIGIINEATEFLKQQASRAMS